MGVSKMLFEMKVKFNKDLFKLLDKLSGEPICCASCEHFSSPAKMECMTKGTYYEYKNRQGQIQILWFCENYTPNSNGKK